jgi:succinate dehydrogenase / fumarate reductase cytochrome b subunit
MLLGILWAFFHHFCAGLRHLAMDLHWGTGLAKARVSGKLVLVISLLLTLLAGVKLWLW